MFYHENAVVDVKGRRGHAPLSAHFFFQFDAVLRKRPK